MGQWGFVVAAYALVAVVLVVYWGRVERRLREITPSAMPKERGR
jgi:hypothetical protein